MTLSEIKQVSSALKKLERQGVNTIRQAQIVLCLANQPSCCSSVPDACLYTGIKEDAARAVMQKLESKGIVKTIDVGSRAMNWQLTTSMWDVILSGK